MYALQRAVRKHATDECTFYIPCIRRLPSRITLIIYNSIRVVHNNVYILFYFVLLSILIYAYTYIMLCTMISGRVPVSVRAARYIHTQYDNNNNNILHTATGPDWGLITLHTTLIAPDPPPSPSPAALAACCSGWSYARDNVSENYVTIIMIIIIWYGKNIWKRIFVRVTDCTSVNVLLLCVHIHIWVDIIIQTTSAYIIIM